MSTAQEIHKLSRKIPHPSPGTIARDLDCPVSYVLRVAWPETYRSVKAGERSRKSEARMAA
jgi:hypothetical protein